MENQLNVPRKISFHLKAHDSHSLVVILRSVYSFLNEVWQGNQSDDAKKWLVTIDAKVAEFCAIAHDQDGSEFWHTFRNVTAGFRALEGALNDSGNGYEAKVSFDPPKNRTFAVSVHHPQTGRFFEAIFRPKHIDSVDLRCCVFADPFDKMDALHVDAEHLRDSAHHFGGVVNVEMLEVENGCNALTVVA